MDVAGAGQDKPLGRDRELQQLTSALAAAVAGHGSAISEHDRELGAHFEWAVRTGMTCSCGEKLS